MREVLLTLWRERKRYLLLICSIWIGSFTVCTVLAISELANRLIDRELEAMGMDGLIVTSTGATITDADVTAVSALPFIRDSTPLCYRYCQVTVGSQSDKVLLWGIDDRVYDTVSIQLLHGRLLTDADSGSLCGMVDAAFAQNCYGRENIVGKELTVPIGSIPVKLRVVGVVKTGGGLTAGLMGSTVPSFLYLPLNTMQQYLGKGGYHHLMLTLEEQADPESCSAAVAALCSAGTEVQNFSGSKQQMQGVLSIITAVLLALGSICFITSGISMMTVMLQNIREQTPLIGIKKALGATDFQIASEYLLQAWILAVSGGLLGGITSLLLLELADNLLSLAVNVEWDSVLSAAIPGILIATLFGVYPAKKAAGCIPANAINRLS